MTIKYGQYNINNMYFGDVNVSKVYLGESEVYTKPDVVTVRIYENEVNTSTSKLNLPGYIGAAYSGGIVKVGISRSDSGFHITFYLDDVQQSDAIINESSPSCEYTFTSIERTSKVTRISDNELRVDNSKAATPQ